jgi:hypothetical protein
LTALVALAAIGLYLALVQTAPVRVLEGVPERPPVTRDIPVADAGSLDELLDATKIQHTVGGR